MAKKTFKEIIKEKADAGYQAGLDKSEKKISEINIIANAMMMFASLGAAVLFYLHGPDSMILKMVLIALCVTVTISSMKQVSLWMNAKNAVGRDVNLDSKE